MATITSLISATVKLERAMPMVVGCLTPTVIKVTAAARAATVLVKVAAVAAVAVVRKAVARRVGNVSQAKSVVQVPARNTLFSVALRTSDNKVCGDPWA